MLFCGHMGYYAPLEQLGNMNFLDPPRFLASEFIRPGVILRDLKRGIVVNPLLYPPGHMGVSTHAVPVFCCCSCGGRQGRFVSKERSLRP